MALLSSPLPVAAGNLRPVRRRSPARGGESSLSIFSYGHRNRRLSSFLRPCAAKREEWGGEVSGDKPSKKQTTQKGKGLGKVVSGLDDLTKKVPDILGDVDDLAKKVPKEASGAARKLTGKAVSEASEIVDKFLGKTGAAVSEASEIVGQLEVKAGNVVSEGSDIIYKFTEKSGAAVSETSEKIADKLEEKAGDAVSGASEIVDKLEENGEEAVSEASEIIDKLFGKRGASVSKSSEIVDKFPEKAGKGFSKASEIVEKEENAGSAVSDASDIGEKLEERVEAPDAEALKTFDELLAKTRARISEAYEIVDKFNRKPGALAPEILGNLGPRAEISDAYEIVDKIPEKADAQNPEVSESLDEMLAKARTAISEASELVDKVAEKSGVVLSEPSEIVDTVEEKALETVDKVEEKAGTEVLELRENVAPINSGVSGIPDEWGERGEPEAETLIKPDPPKDDDEWGMDPEYDGSDALLRDNALEDLKLCLVDTFYGTEFGLTASSEVRGEVFELVNQLEALNPTPSPMEAPELLDGNWILLYTAFSELLPLLAIGSVPLLKVKRISQEVDSRSLIIKNSTTISSPFATFSFSASASFKVQTPSRIQVRFREGSFEPPEISQTIDLPESTEVFGQRVYLNPLRQALGPLQGAAASIARAISGQPPLKVPIPGERSQSWLVTTFLDKDLRISRGDGGLFILAREGSPLLNI